MIILGCSKFEQVVLNIYTDWGRPAMTYMIVKDVKEYGPIWRLCLNVDGKPGAEIANFKDEEAAMHFSRYYGYPTYTVRLWTKVYE